jgi:hypothetical protein
MSQALFYLAFSLIVVVDGSVDGVLTLNYDTSLILLNWSGKKGRKCRPSLLKYEIQMDLNIYLYFKL